MKIKYDKIFAHEIFAIYGMYEDTGIFTGLPYAGELDTNTLIFNVCVCVCVCVCVATSLVYIGREGLVVRLNYYSVLQLPKKTRPCISLHFLYIYLGEDLG